MEIELILKMIELLNAGHPETFIQEYPAFLDGRVSLSLLDLARVRSFDGLLDVLQGTPYAALLQQHRPLGNATSDYAACEATLMTYYFARIEALVRQNFHGKTKQQLLDILQTNLELTNICMIYRMKKYFPQANAPEIQKHLLPLWNRIPQKHLEQLLAAQGVAEFLEKLASSPYAVQTGSDDFVFIEYTGNCVRCKMSRRYLRFATDAPTAFTAYMALQRTELYNLITILEGVRYEMEPPEIQKMLLL